MKIGFVLDDSLDKTDGVQQYVLTLGQWLRREGHVVHYLVGQTKRTDIGHIHSLSRNVQAHFNQNRMSIPLPSSTKPIKALLRRERFDVLHVQMPYSPFMAAKVIKHAPPETAIVGTFHILPFSKLEARATRLLRMVLRRSVRRFDRVVSVSEPAAKFAEKSFRVRSEVLPNAVNVANFVAGKKIRKYNDGKLNMVYLGRLVERKGCLYFLQALDRLHKEHLLHNARVIIAGKGPLEDQLRKYVAEHRLGKIVQFVGYVSEADKPNYLASADIAVLPSTGGESFGIVVVEAMAAGADVVIGGNNRGYRSILGEQKDQLVKPTDTPAFARTLKHYIISVSARQRARKWQAAQVARYDVRVIGGRLLHIYEEALRKKRSVR